MSKKSIIAILIAALSMAMITGCSSSSSSDKPAKVGEVGKTNETTEEKEEPAAEQADENKKYHVGDTVMDDNLQIVYVASGVYQESNQYLKPNDGNQYVFVKFAFENKGDSDTSITSFSFNGYADGYNVDQHYTDEDFSATLSPGRTTSGLVVFEVPKDASEIEVEYEVNYFTGKKIVFVYDGEADSGYVQEANTAASENAFKVGDIVESKNLNISYLSCEKDTSYSQYSKPADGHHYVTLTFEFENKGSSDEYVSTFDFQCYADGSDCEMAYFRDDALGATLSAGRKGKGTVTFEVPDNAATVEVEFVANYWTSSRVVFTVTE